MGNGTGLSDDRRVSEQVFKHNNNKGVVKSTDPFGSVDITFGGKSTDPSIRIGSVDITFCSKSTDPDFSERIAAHDLVVAL